MAILYRFLIGKGSSSITVFKYAARACYASANSLKIEMSRQGIWHQVSDYIVGYMWEYDKESRQSMRFALLDDEFAALICEMSWPRSKRDNVPDFAYTIDSDTIMELS